MSPGAQAKLLRVLVDGQVQRVGSTKMRKVDVRVLAATHQNLQERVKQGLFREDLYYRLAVFPISLPPLRDRKEDIPGLCELLSRQIARDLKVQPRSLSAEALRTLMEYSFPGNVRELRNLLERAHILALGPEIDEVPVTPETGQVPERHADVWRCLEGLSESLDFRAVLADVERCLLQRALTRAGGVQAEAARMLNLSRSDFGYKATKYALVRGTGGNSI